MSEPMIWLLVRGVWETLAMTFVRVQPLQTPLLKQG